MKKALIALLLLTSITTKAQLKIDGDTLRWTSSTWDKGFGYQFYTADPGNFTLLNIAARHNTKTWTDMVSFSSFGLLGIQDRSPEHALSVGGSIYSSGKIILGPKADKVADNAKGLAAGIKLGGKYQAAADIEFIVSDYRSGFGTRFFPVDPQDGHGTTLLKIQGRTDSNQWTDLMTFNNNSYATTTHSRLMVNNAKDDGSTALKVNGDMVAKRVRVTQIGWPDFVFDNSYQLPSLQSIATYVSTHKHLPGIPTAATVEKDGQDVGEMNKLLLQKVEELTLYLIQMNEKVNKIEKENAELRKRLK